MQVPHLFPKNEPPCGDEVDSGISGHNTQTEEEAGGASRFSRHAELRGDETGAAAVLLVTSSEEELGIFSQQLQNGGGRIWSQSATVQSGGIR